MRPLSEDLHRARLRWLLKSATHTVLPAQTQKQRHRQMMIEMVKDIVRKGFRR